jgi:hypothetical protein
VVLEGAELSPLAFANAVKRYLDPTAYASAAQACRSITHIPAQTARSLLGDGDFSEKDQMLPAEFIARLLLTRLEKQAKEGT